MKLRQESEIEVQDIGEVGEIKSTIADENLGLALTMMSKNLYSDPIGSFIREITSNAVDANVDANVDEPVIVHLFEEDDAYYIEFKDNGTGMSPDTFQSIYMSWFNSDKRDTNDKIGGWGLGSKSPLAYQNFFEIITRHEGTKYHYVMSNESTEPKADKLTEEETTEPNGTTIRIEVKPEDIHQVSRDCERQLAYFKTVYVKNELEYYDNNFNIYEKGLWKLRNINQPFATMHICLGQVAYPINWEVLAMEPIRVPIALNFEVGDLDVTVSREEINYTDRVRELVTQRVNSVVDEISDLYNEQLVLDDIFEYFKVVSNREKPELKIEDVSIRMTAFKGKLRFKGFPTLKVKKEDAHMIFAGYTVSRLYSGKLDKNYSRIHLRFSEVVNAYLVKDKMNFHDSKWIGDALLLKKRKHTKKTFHALAVVLDLVQCTTESVYNEKHIYKPGAASKIAKFSKFIDHSVTDRLASYDGICPEYEKESYREEQRHAAQRRKDNVTYYTIDGARKNTNVQALLDKKFVFYVNRDKPFDYKSTVHAMYKTFNDNFVSSTSLIFLAQTAINKLKKHENIMQFEEVFALPEMSNHFYGYNIAHMIEENIEPLSRVFKFSDHYMNMYNKLLNKFGTTLTVKVHTEKYDRHSYRDREVKKVNLYEYFNDYITKATTTKNYEEYRSIYRELLFVGTQLEILKYLVQDTPPHIVAGLIKGKGVTKLNEQFYKTDIS